ncbi:NADPH:quinone reductase-like Zn-dependent oxidoreductase [Streptosporangium album]|uniref:NADPH:quinone reductase-like Zn-dependent oxidoreductase n=1 Tax=Streptosporangium album TaxID=47479 RepID=A0A7W7RQR2_9ACTN|nr:hypothetical protein [Streptosporangium album]MBB4936454.1 NADPH:quinone reductase-like Zn-dependent oxidoreductase [Streptosporangium album]
MSIRALIVDPAAPAALRLGDIDDPAPRPHQTVIDVRHISLNRGEIAFARQQAPGTVLGYDASGIVSRAAADGSGPAVGTRVAAFGAGAWAQRMAVGTDSVAEIPDEVDLADAAALPMAGVTALRTLRAAPILGKRVLIWERSEHRLGLRRAGCVRAVLALLNRPVQVDEHLRRRHRVR